MYLHQYDWYEQCVKAESIAKLIKRIIVGEMAIDNGRPANTAVYIIMWEEIAPNSIINKCKKKRTSQTR